MIKAKEASDRPPTGLLYDPNFIARSEAARLLQHIRTLRDRWERAVMRGRETRRKMVQFGWTYVSAGRRLQPAGPMPECLAALRDRCAEFAGAGNSTFDQAIVANYPRGAGIGWHVDAPVFGGVLLGIPLMGSARMHFRRRDSGQRYVLDLAPRSLLVLRGESRWDWEHRIPAVKRVRISVTFRSVAGGGTTRDDACVEMC